MLLLGSYFVRFALLLFLGSLILGGPTCCEAFSSFCGQSIGYQTSSTATKSSSKASPSRCLLTMKVRVGILGLPNVGKSSLFNALAKQSIAQAANFPFCTIDPNIAQITIPDPYLKRLGQFAKSQRTVSASMEWVDVAGLAKGAHRGEGLGNQFLGNLRDCQAVCHVVRAFEDPNVVHVDGTVDPVSDISAIQLELLFADLAHIERRLERTSVSEEERSALEIVLDGLNKGIPARAVGLNKEAKFSIKSMGLLTLKPVMYAFNVDEVDYVLGRNQMTETAKNILDQVENFDPITDLWTLVSAKVESEISLLPEMEQKSYLESIGVDDIEQVTDLFSYKVLPNLARQLLGYTLVYTGPGVPLENTKTTRAHMIQSSSSSSLTADGIAGRIHGKIQKGFIRAEVTSASKLLEHSNYVSAKESGCVRSEGRDYHLQSDDVVLIKWKGG